MVNGFNVAFALMTVVWGALADRIGHHRIFRTGVVVVLVASILSGLSSSLLMLDLARIAAGAGAAAVLTSATSILSLAWHGDARTAAFALFGTVNGVGLALGPTICGAVTQAAGWRGALVLPALFLLVSLLASGRVPRPRTVPTSGPLLDVSLLRHRPFLAMVLVPVAGAFGFVTFLTYLPAAFSAVHGWDAGSAGAAMLIATAPVILGPALTNRVMRRFDLNVRTVIAASLCCLIIGGVGMVALTPQLPWTAIIPAMLAIGFGFGLPLGIVDAEALRHIPAERSGSAAGLLNLARIGSEALTVAGYSAAVTLLVRHRVVPERLADAVAAGAPGHATDYAWAQHMTAFGVAAVVAALMLAYRVLAGGARGPVSRPGRPG